MWTRLSKSPGLRLALGLLASLALLYLAFRQTTFAAVWEVITQADPKWVAAALACVLATAGCKVVRWRVMLGPAGKPVRFVDLFMAHQSGQMLNAVFPLRVGDVSRSVVIGREGAGWAFVLGSVALEKIVDMVWLALTFLLLILLIPLPAWMGSSGWLLVVAAGLMGALTFALAANRRRLAPVIDRLEERIPPGWGRVRRWSMAAVAQMHRGLASLDVLQQRGDLARIAFWSTLIWTAGVLTNYLVLLSLDLHLPLSASLLVLVGLMVGISVATVPGRIGVFEWICVLALGVYGVDQTEALSYGLLLHVIAYAPMIVLGVISFFVLTHRRARNAPETPGADEQPVELPNH